MSYTIRKATPDDLSVIMHQRRSMFLDMGHDVQLVQAMETPFRPWIADRLANGTYQGWFAVDADGQVVAGAGLWLHEWIPSPLAPEPLRGYILNVYTERGWRRQGIARRLVEEILAYCEARQIRLVTLHASDQGRPIYEALGFIPSSEMRIHLPPG